VHEVVPAVTLQRVRSDDRWVLEERKKNATGEGNDFGYNFIVDRLVIYGN
jgi:hypothetical protein